jgi:hypothetical protein
MCWQINGGKGETNASEKKTLVGKIQKTSPVTNDPLGIIQRIANGHALTSNDLA